MNKTNILDIVWCCVLLQECISTKYIEDEEHILSNIKAVKEHKDLIPKKLGGEVDRFIEKTIKPILNPNYFSFICKPEYGYYEEDRFIINSEKSLYMLMYEFFEHSIKLNVELLKIFSKYIR